MITKTKVIDPLNYLTNNFVYSAFKLFD